MIKEQYQKNEKEKGEKIWLPLSPMYTLVYIQVPNHL